MQAALACFARYGVAKTNLDDVAREAGCSRATIYRLFPGGKDGLVSTVVDSELARFRADLEAAIAGAEDLEDLLVRVLVHSSSWLCGHPALRFVVEHEPGLVLPRIAFGEIDPVLDLAAGFLEPHLSPPLGPEDARRVGEWLARIVLSYLLAPPEAVAGGGSLPPSASPLDEHHARRLVRTFVLPGVELLETPEANLEGGRPPWHRRTRR